ncbi:hypothetical protein SAMN06264364_105161 [Quadrisphaera granulorum]|uniref:Uncharacterized protein n=2 Tax=Quadrisphaera granulorum TaxID=317664 RepID=A0A316ABJ5_9ACTN|nr:hypothetical protein BXY45_105161 [Quadrisphaera granulorum]SZE95898.1 hypothetical protein SAMN06264364_105161 [Quadrisphaera granulorum]
MAPSSFFPDFTPAPDDQDEELPDELYGVWDGPPQRVRPGVADLVVELGRSEYTVVAAQGAEVYATGVVFDLVVHPRERGREALRRVLGLARPQSRTRSAEPGPQAGRTAVGRRAG